MGLSVAAGGACPHPRLFLLAGAVFTGPASLGSPANCPQPRGTHPEAAWGWATSVCPHSRSQRERNSAGLAGLLGWVQGGQTLSSSGTPKPLGVTSREAGAPGACCTRGGGRAPWLTWAPGQPCQPAPRLPTPGSRLPMLAGRHNCSFYFCSLQTPISLGTKKMPSKQHEFLLIKALPGSGKERSLSSSQRGVGEGRVGGQGRS